MTNRCCDEYSFNLYYYVILSIYFRRNISRDGYANRSSCYTCATFESCSRRRGREITSRGKRGRRKKKRKANKGKCTGRVSTKELSRTMAATSGRTISRISQVSPRNLPTDTLRYSKTLPPIEVKWWKLWETWTVFFLITSLVMEYRPTSNLNRVSQLPMHLGSLSSWQLGTRN